MGSNEWRTHHPDGTYRVVVTKELPGQRWLNILTAADCRVVIGTSTDILDVDEIKTVIGDRCDGAIGQLTEPWGEALFSSLKKAGARAYSNYAVGYNNVDLAAANRHGIPVGNTPGVLTEATAEMCVTLAYTAARRVGEAERFMRAGKYKGWLPTLFIGKLFNNGTVGVVGAGRIGAAFARMMSAACHMHVLYQDISPNPALEKYIAAYSDFLVSQGEEPVTCRRCDTVEELLRESNLISVNTILDDTTHHLINAERLAIMKKDAVLVNASRGPVVDEKALVTHCEHHPDFRVGLDVFENEPAMQPGLKQLDNVVIVPHIASATAYTREGMAALAAGNVAGLLHGYPAWQRPDIRGFVEGNAPRAAPSIVNAEAIGYPIFKDA